MNDNSETVEAQMLIRKAVEVVFNAFIDPSITKNFWFTKGSDILKIGKTVTWTWEMYNVSTEVYVKNIVENEKISIEWNNPKTTVDFEFKQLSATNTYVTIKNYGFEKDGTELLNIIKDSTAGFTTVLDGLKAYLEHNINLNLIADKFPKELSNYGQNK